MNSHCQIAFVHRKKTTRTTTTTKNSLTLRVNEKSREHCRQTRAKSILILVKKENIKNQHRNRCECNDWPCAYCMHACDRGTWNESKIESIFCYFQTTPFAGHNQSISIGRYDRGQDDTPVGNRARWSMDFSRDHDLLCKINISFFFFGFEFTCPHGEGQFDEQQTVFTLDKQPTNIQLYIFRSAISCVMENCLIIASGMIQHQPLTQSAAGTKQ